MRVRIRRGNRSWSGSLKVLVSSLVMVLGTAANAGRISCTIDSDNEREFTIEVDSYGGSILRWTNNRVFVPYYFGKTFDLYEDQNQSSIIEINWMSEASANNIESGVLRIGQGKKRSFMGKFSEDSFTCKKSQ